MKRLILFAGCLCALTLAAAAIAQIRGGTPYQRHVLADALKSLRASGVSVEISEHPKGVGPRLRNRRERQLTFSGPSDLESGWKSWITAGVFAARGIGLTWVSVPKLGTARYHRATGPFDPATRVEIVHAIRAAAHADGVRLDRIELLHPLSFAPVVRITVPDRVRLRFEQHCGLLRSLESLLDYRKPRVEGLFVIARDARGHVWSRGGTALRLGIGAGTRSSRFCHL